MLTAAEYKSKKQMVELIPPIEKINDETDLQAELRKLKEREAEILAFESRPKPTEAELQAIKSNQDIADRIKLTEQLLIQAEKELSNAKEVCDKAELKVKITMDILKKLKK